MARNEEILCIRVGGLGDLLAALPSLGLLRRSLPGRRLILLGRPEYGKLLASAGVVDEVADAGGPEFADLLAGSEAAAASARPRLERFSRVFGWMNNRERGRAIEALLDSLGLRSAIAGFDSSSGRTVSRFFFERTAAALLLDPDAATFDECARLPLPSVEPRERLVVIHPGSGGIEKRWPLDRFLEIARRLADRGFVGGIALGEAEAGLVDEIKRAPLPPGWQGLDRPPLSFLSHLLGRAALYIGNDSGVTHLAAACGTLVLALFLDKYLSAWAPFGRTRILAAPAIADIETSRVWTEAAARLGLPSA
jgi:heptosyltransferase-3